MQIEEILETSEPTASLHGGHMAGLVTGDDAVRSTAYFDKSHRKHKAEPNTVFAIRRADLLITVQYAPSSAAVWIVFHAAQAAFDRA